LSWSLFFLFNLCFFSSWSLFSWRLFTQRNSFYNFNFSIHVNSFYI
jgi:hypothetical protein